MYLVVVPVSCCFCFLVTGGARATSTSTHHTRSAANTSWPLKHIVCDYSDMFGYHTSAPEIDDCGTVGLWDCGPFACLCPSKAERYDEWCGGRGCGFRQSASLRMRSEHGLSTLPHIANTSSLPCLQARLPLPLPLLQGPWVKIVPGSACPLQPALYRDCYVYYLLVHYRSIYCT
jgi:hypothetical protein